jgi:TP901 family phage tail tape measure protein
MLGREGFIIEVDADIRKYQQKWIEIANSPNSLVTKMAQLSSAFGGQLQTMGTQLGLLSLVSAAAFAKIVSGYARWEQAVADAASITGKGQEAIIAFGEASQRAAIETGVTASEAAKALYYLASANFSVTESATALNGVLSLAAATQSDIAFTAKAVAMAIRAFDLEASDSMRVANVYAATISKTQATMETLSDAMGYVAAAARSAKMSIEETSAALGVLFSRGIRGTQAGTGLRTALMSLAAPTAAAKKAFAEMGLSVAQLDPTLNSMADIIKLLEERHMTLAQSVAIFSKRSGVQMLALAQAGHEAYETLLKGITGTSKASEMMQMQLNTVSGSLRILRGSFEEVTYAIVEGFAPSLINLASGLSVVAQGTADLARSGGKNMQSFLARVATGTAIFTAVLSGMGLFLSQFVKIAASFGGITLFLEGLGPIAAVITGAIMGIGYAIEKVGERSRKEKMFLEGSSSQLMMMRDTIKLYRQTRQEIKGTTDEQQKLIMLNTKALESFGGLTEQQIRLTAVSELATIAYMEQQLVQQQNIVYSNEDVKAKYRQYVAIKQTLDGLLEYRDTLEKQKETEAALVKQRGTASPVVPQVENLTEVQKILTNLKGGFGGVEAEATKTATAMESWADKVAKAMEGLPHTVEGVDIAIGTIRGEMAGLVAYLESKGLQVAEANPFKSFQEAIEKMMTSLGDADAFKRVWADAIDRILDMGRKFERLTPVQKFKEQLADTQRFFDKMVAMTWKSGDQTLKVFAQGYGSLIPVIWHGEMQMMTIGEYRRKVELDRDETFNEDRIVALRDFNAAMLGIDNQAATARISLIEDEGLKALATKDLQFKTELASQKDAAFKYILEQERLGKDMTEAKGKYYDLWVTMEAAHQHDMAEQIKTMELDRIDKTISAMNLEGGLLKAFYAKILQLHLVSSLAEKEIVKRQQEVVLKDRAAFWVGLYNAALDYFGKLQTLFATSITTSIFGGAEQKAERQDQEQAYLDELTQADLDIQTAMAKGDTMQVRSLQRRQRAIGHQLDELRKTFVGKLKDMSVDVLTALVEGLLKKMFEKIGEWLGKMIMEALVQMGIIQAILAFFTPIKALSAVLMPSELSVMSPSYLGVGGPHLQAGAIVRGTERGLVTRVAEHGVTEVVSPVDKLSSMISNAMKEVTEKSFSMDKLGAMISAAIPIPKMAAVEATPVDRLRSMISDTMLSKMVPTAILNDISGKLKSITSNALQPRLAPMVVFQDTIDLRGTVVMANDDKVWDDVYRNRILKARKKYMREFQGKLGNREVY